MNIDGGIYQYILREYNLKFLRPIAVRFARLNATSDSKTFS